MLRKTNVGLLKNIKTGLDRTREPFSLLSLKVLAEAKQVVIHPLETMNIRIRFYLKESASSTCWEIPAILSAIKMCKT